MITMITGVPGSGKSLYAVWELLRPLQGATFEHDGQAVPRQLFTNIKDLLLDHVKIGGDNLNTWHDWVKPGDVIAFDEVQEVWRPRSMGANVPPHIAALETHRHKGCDFVLITQHPMLLDQNIRRLVGRHLHVRRVANMPLAIVYEWDHASDPGKVKSAMSTKPWRYPGKKGYALYKSAEAHTKQPRSIPFHVIALAITVVAGAVFFPWAMSRMGDRFTFKPSSAAQAASVSKPKPAPTPLAPPQNAPTAPRDVLTAVLPAPGASAPPKFSGCIASAKRCTCYGPDGVRAEVEPAVCNTHTGGDLPAKAVALNGFLDPPAPSTWRPSDADREVFAYMHAKAVRDIREQFAVGATPCLTNTNDGRRVAGCQ